MPLEREATLNEGASMGFEDDEHLDVCQNIEFGLKEQYEINPALTDSQCIFALENAKVAIKKQFGFAANERVANNEQAKGIIDWCVAVGLQRVKEDRDLSLKEYVKRIEKVRKSVVRHAVFGPRGYYEFISKFT